MNRERTFTNFPLNLKAYIILVPLKRKMQTIKLKLASKKERLVQFVAKVFISKEFSSSAEAITDR